eukprot:2840854-Rhodomonas_salina.1
MRSMIGAHMSRMIAEARRERYRTSRSVIGDWTCTLAVCSSFTLCRSPIRALSTGHRIASA